MRLPRALAPRTVVRAHCDLPCGIYDPAQARIEAESVKAISEKHQANSDPELRTRALVIKEQRAELVKHHLWVLWTDYFKPPHFEKYPHLHQLFNEATKLAGASLAARLQFTLDEIEDLRIAVDEACAILLSIAPAQAEVTSQFEVTDSALSIDVSVPVTGQAALPGGNSFSWQVLTALAGEVSAQTDGDRAAIRLTKRRTLPPV